MVYVITVWKINLCKHSNWKFQNILQEMLGIFVCFPYSETCQTNNQRGQRDTIPDLHFMLLKKTIGHEEETINS